LSAWNYKKYSRVRQGEYKFANGKEHINKMETLWSFAARKLIPLAGVL
jgi:hypothetical protein